MIADGDGLEIEKHAKGRGKYSFFARCVDWIHSVGLSMRKYIRCTVFESLFIDVKSKAVSQRVDADDKVRLLLKVVGNGAGSMEWESDRDGKLTYVCDQLSHALGRSSQRLLGTRLWDVVDKQGWVGTWLEVAHCFAAHKGFENIIVKTSMKPDADVWSISAVPLLSKQGFCNGYYGVCYSVRDEHNVRKAQTKAVKDVRNQLDLSARHLAQISSDLQKPLRDISGLAHVSGEYWREKTLSPEASSFAQRLDFTSQYVLCNIRDFAESKQTEQVESCLDEQFLDPNELITNAVCFAQPWAMNLNVIIEKSEKLHRILFQGDLKRLRQMLVRGLFIGVERSGIEGRVWLSASIQNNGELAFCFKLECAENSKSSKTSKIMEMGRQNLLDHWGLVLVARLAELHGGRLAVHFPKESNISRWSVYLPKSRVRLVHR